MQNELRTGRLCMHKDIQMHETCLKFPKYSANNIAVFLQCLSSGNIHVQTNCAQNCSCIMQFCGKASVNELHRTKS